MYAREIRVTEAAASVTRQMLREFAGEELAFFVDNGWCEAQGLQLLQVLYHDPANVQVAEVEGVPVYCQEPLAVHWRDVVLDLDVVRQESSDAFSVETEWGYRFRSWVHQPNKNGEG